MNEQCWSLTNKPERNGYVKLSKKLAHRLFYETFIGTIPTELVIDHLCFNRSCVNPKHLEAVTQRQNVLRSDIALPSVNIKKTHCPQGHEYTINNTRINKITKRRQCRECNKQHQRLYMQKIRSSHVY